MGDTGGDAQEGEVSAAAAAWPGRGADRAAARGAVADRTRVPGPAAVAAGARAGRRDGARRPLRHRRRPGAAGDSVSAWRVRVVSPGIARRETGPVRRADLAPRREHRGGTQAALPGDHSTWSARRADGAGAGPSRSEEHTSELQSREKLVCRL